MYRLRLDHVDGAVEYVVGYNRGLGMYELGPIEKAKIWSHRYAEHVFGVVDFLQSLHHGQGTLTIEEV